MALALSLALAGPHRMCLKRFQHGPGSGLTTCCGFVANVDTLIFGKMSKFPGSGTGWETAWKNVSGALREQAATEKRGEEAGGGQGASALVFGGSGAKKTRKKS